MKIALKVGGSVFCPTESPDMEFVGKLSKVLLDLKKEHDIAVIVGGGRLARKMMEEARAIGIESDEELHQLGIEAARKNASVLVKALGGGAFPDVPRNEEEVRHALESGKIVAVGGFRLGQTTDAVTLQSAEAIGADLVIIGTDVKGVYDKDPKRHKDARFISYISASELLDLVDTESVEPGAKTIIDPVAVRIMIKTGMRTAVLDITNLDNLRKAVLGTEFEGTLVR
ncbi:MAG: UMP kinase [Candidatus Aenigmatarchaeota archaeon]|nr:MAG: UMP kinase [Candidatus Aenigmarchaeota archaeon]